MSSAQCTCALAADWPSEVLSQVDGGRILLGRPGKGDRIPGIWVKGSNPPVLVVHPDGAEAARGTPEVARLVEAGRSVLMIDAFQTGSAVAPRDRSVKNFLTFNKSDDANRVQDILTALGLVGRKAGRRPKAIVCPTPHRPRQSCRLVPLRGRGFAPTRRSAG